MLIDNQRSKRVAPLSGSWFYCPPKYTLEATESFRIPSMSVSTDLPNSSGFACVKINFDKNFFSGGTVGSSVQDSIELEHPELVNFKHDFTFKMFTNQTDQRIGKYFPPLDKNDNLTPDFIHKNDGEINVVEFATVMSTEERPASTSFELKKMKYYESLRSRAIKNRCKTNFYIIIVTPIFVITNLRDVEDSVVNELCFRLRLSNSINADLVRLDLIPDSTEVELSKSAKEIKAMFQSMVFKQETAEERDFLGKAWDPEFIEEVINDELETQKISDHILEVMRKTVSESEEKLVEINTINHDLGVKFTSSIVDSLLGEFKMSLKSWEQDNKSKTWRVDKKSIVIFPGFIPKKKQCHTTKIECGSLPFINSQCGHREDKLFFLAQEFVFEHSEFFQDTDFVPDGMTAEEWFLKYEKSDEPFDALRKKYHRVTVDIPEESLVYFATKGIAQKKGLFTSKPVVDLRAEKKKPFNVFNCPTSDLDRFFVNKTNLEKRTGDYKNISDVCVLDLISKAYEIQKPPSELQTFLIDFVSMYMTSNLGMYGNFLTELGIELNSSMKQHCQSREFVFKQLPNYDIYLLIKPTNSESHIFFSMLLKKTDVLATFLEEDTRSKIFKPFLIGEEYIFTEFVSIDQSKITNLIITESRFLNILTFFMDFHGYSPYNTDIFFEDTVLTRQIWFDVKFAMLIHLSDKEETEMEITKSRFIEMEGFVSYPDNPKPLKMIKKMNKHPRSRLTVWIQKQQFKRMKVLHSGFRLIMKPKTSLTEEDEVTESVWLNLKHPFQHIPLNDPGKLVQLFYLGYLNNKNRKTHKNVEGKLVEKILDMESDFFKNLQDDETVEEKINNIGTQNLKYDEVRYHEYNPYYLKLITLNLINQGRQQYGGNFLDLLEQDVLNALANLKVEDFLMTLKATCNFNSETEDYVRDENYKRSKVIEKLLENLREERTVTDFIPRILPIVEEDDCLRVDIFKKAQFGGLREIYVLSFHCRIIQLIVETISRSICKKFDTECMTNPKSKTSFPILHNKRMKESHGGSFNTTIGLSDDAEKWNQCHYVSKFFLMLSMLLPKYFRPFLKRSMSLWMKKKIKIPPALLDIFENNEKLELESDSVKELYECFKGRKTCPWYTVGKNYMYLRTGFMQGILHYTSSLLHTAHIEYIRKISGAMCLNLNNRSSPIMTCLVSSDDSSLLLSLKASTKAEQRMNLISNSSIGPIKTRLGLLAGIFCSVKSTQNTSNCFEFNSNFFFNFSKVNTYIKDIFSSSLISEMESLQARSEEMNSLISKILGNGGPLCVINMAQVAQALLFYKILGSSSNRFFYHFAKNICEVPDPSSGFFFLDNPMFPGLMGYKFNLWLACKRTSLGKLMHSMFNTEDMTFEKIKEVVSKGTTLDNLNLGSGARKILLPFGNRKKWARLVKNSDLIENWEEQINEMPEILYRKSKTSEETRLKIAMKLHQPSVSKAFDKGNNLPRIMSASIYTITNRVLMPISSWFTQVLEEDLELDRIGCKSLDRIRSGNSNEIEFVTNDGPRYFAIFKDKLVSNNFSIQNFDGSFRNLVIPVGEGKDYKNNHGLAVFRKLGLNYDQVLDFEIKKGEYLIREYLDKEGNEITVAFLCSRVVRQSKLNPIHYKNAFRKLMSDKEGPSSNLFSNCHPIQILPFNAKRDGFPVRQQLEFFTNIILNYTQQFILRTYDLELVKNTMKISRSTALTRIEGPEEKEDGMNGVLKRTKFSLLGLTFSNKAQSKGAELTEEEECFLFPMRTEYSKFNTLMSKLEIFKVVRKPRKYKRTSHTINISEVPEDLEISEIKLISDIWFNTDFLKTSSSVKRELFFSLKQSLPWLRDSPSETLATGFFKSHVEIFNWLLMNERTVRRVKIDGVQVPKSKYHQDLTSFIINNFSTEFRVTLKMTDHERDSITSEKNILLEDIKHTIYMILNSPFENNYKLNAITTLLQNSPSLPFNKKVTRSRNNSLAIMQTILKKTMTLEDIAKLVTQNKRGVVGYWSKPQKRERRDGLDFWTGDGVWKGICNDIKLKIYVTNRERVTIISMVVAIRGHTTCEVIEAIELWKKTQESLSNIIVTRIQPHPSEVSCALRAEEAQGSKLEYKESFLDLVSVPRGFGIPIYSRDRIPGVDLFKPLNSCSISLTENGSLSITGSIEELVPIQKKRSRLEAPGTSRESKPNMDSNWRTEPRSVPVIRSVTVLEPRTFICPIVFYRPRSTDFNPAFSSVGLISDFKSVLRAYVGLDSLSIKGVNKLISLIDEDSPMLEIFNVGDLRLWLRELSIGTLNRMGLVNNKLEVLSSLYTETNLEPEQDMTFDVLSVLKSVKENILNLQTDSTDLGVLSQVFSEQSSPRIEEEDHLDKFKERLAIERKKLASQALEESLISLGRLNETEPGTSQQEVPSFSSWAEQVDYELEVEKNKSPDTLTVDIRADDVEEASLKRSDSAGIDSFVTGLNVGLLDHKALKAFKQLSAVGSLVAQGEDIAMEQEEQVREIKFLSGLKTHDLDFFADVSDSESDDQDDDEVDKEVECPTSETTQGVLSSKDEEKLIIELDCLEEVRDGGKKVLVSPKRKKVTFTESLLETDSTTESDDLSGAHLSDSIVDFQTNRIGISSDSRRKNFEDDHIDTDTRYSELSTNKSIRFLEDFFGTMVNKFGRDAISDLVYHKTYTTEMDTSGALKLLMTLLDLEKDELKIKTISLEDSTASAEDLF